MSAVRRKAIGVLLLAGLVLFFLPAASGAVPAWQSAPVIPSLSNGDQARLKDRVAAGERTGLRSGVFAKVGDSNTEFSPDLYGLACRKPTGLSAALRGTLATYSRVRLPNARALPGCRPWTSFSRRSSAAQAGVHSTWPLTPVKDLPDESYWAKPPGCPLKGTPLSCEIDATMPRYAMVMLGTNDIGMDIAFGIQPGSRIVSRLGGVVRALLARKVVPVLSTIPPIIRPDGTRQGEVTAGVARSNAGIFELARKWHLPMINLWRALKEPSMIDLGLAGDGLHLSVAGAGGEMVGVQPGTSTFADSVDFTAAGLRYGANRRNLIWLKTLARLDRVTG